MPGAVVVDELVCLVAAEDGRARPGTGGRRSSQVGDTITASTARRSAPSTTSSPRSTGKQPGDDRRRRHRASGGSAPRRCSVELIAAPDDPSRTIVGIVPFDTATRPPAVRGQHRHRADRRAVGRPGVHADADRRAVARRPHRRRTTSPSPARSTSTATSARSAGWPRRSPRCSRPACTTSSCPTAQGDEQIDRAREIAGDDLEIIPVGDARRGAGGAGAARRRSPLRRMSG